MGNLIVLAGDHGSGKTYISKITEISTKPAIKLQFRDFISYTICNILNIHPVKLSWNFCKYQDTIDKVFQRTNKVSYAGSIKSAEYIMKEFFGRNETEISDDDFLNINTRSDLFSLTENIYEELKSNLDINRFLSSFGYIINTDKQNIIYYALTLQEVDFFKSKNIPIIYIDMEYHLRSHFSDKAISSEERFIELEEMKNKSSFVLKNNITLNAKLRKTIPNILRQIHTGTFKPFI